VASSNYVGSSNGSISKTQVVAGKAFNRIIQVSLAHHAHGLPFLIRLPQIWLENTDFSSANSTVSIHDYFHLSHLDHSSCSGDLQYPRYAGRSS
jgi:hypothetical protein